MFVRAAKGCGEEILLIGLDSESKDFDVGIWLDNRRLSWFNCPSENLSKVKK